jgi:tetratricopeptide (TPR) repeat protein
VSSLVEECKKLEKIAKELEKNNPMQAIDKYQEAAACYRNNDKLKQQCFAKAAQLYKEIAKKKEDPDDAYEEYTKAFELFTKAQKPSEAEKSMNEAYQTFIITGKASRAEANKVKDPEVAEQIFARASEYAKKGNDLALSQACWIDSANQFRTYAANVENPRDALEVYKHAIQNYRMGDNEDLEHNTWKDAADKFNNKAISIDKTKKNLVYAIDNYMQAAILYGFGAVRNKKDDLNKRVEEMCEAMGIPIDWIIKFLETQGFRQVTI